jgi:hypothetical protein
MLYQAHSGKIPEINGNTDEILYKKFLRTGDNYVTPSQRTGFADISQINPQRDGDETL